MGTTTIVGAALIILGYVGVFACLMVLAASSSNPAVYRKIPVLRVRIVATAIPASMLLTILGLVISDLRRIPDLLPLVLLAGGLVVVVTILFIVAVVGIRGGGHLAWLVVKVTTAAALPAFAVWYGLSEDDFTSSLIWSSFVFPFLVAIVALAWVLITLVIRRGRVAWRG